MPSVKENRVKKCINDKRDAGYLIFFEKFTRTFFCRPKYATEKKTNGKAVKG